MCNVLCVTRGFRAKLPPKCSKCGISKEILSYKPIAGPKDDANFDA